MQSTDYHTPTAPLPLPQKPPVSELLTNLAEHSTALIKSEWQLLVLEMWEKAKDYRAIALTIGFGAATIFLGVMTLSVAIVNVLANYVGVTLAATIYGGVLLALGTFVLYLSTKE